MIKIKAEDFKLFSKEQPQCGRPVLLFIEGKTGFSFYNSWYKEAAGYNKWTHWVGLTIEVPHTKTAEELKIEELEQDNAQLKKKVGQLRINLAHLHASKTPTIPHQFYDGKQSPQDEPPAFPGEIVD